MVSSQSSQPRFRTSPLGQSSRSPLSGQPKDVPWLLDTLFHNFEYDLEQVAEAIDPILTAQNHCCNSPWYLQGVVVQDRAFLSTNINDRQTIQLTLCDIRWLLGNSTQCTVAVPHQEVALCHAAMSFDPELGFGITDLDSPSGTWVNHCRLAPMQPYSLKDGDLIQLGSMQIEFLQETCTDVVYPAHG